MHYALPPHQRLLLRVRGGHLSIPRVYSGWERRWRIVLTLVLGIYGWQFLRTPSQYRWLDSLDLAIHEAGHLIFAVGGGFLGLLGGTLAQLLLPMAFVVVLWRQGDRHGATIPLWWLGQNCWNIATYVRDARAQELPLVGGGEHDWALLLEQFGMLHRDLAISRMVALVGFVLYGLAIILGLRALATDASDSSPPPSGPPPQVAAPVGQVNGRGHGGQT